MMIRMIRALSLLILHASACCFAATPAPTITRLDWVSRLTALNSAYRAAGGEPQADIERLVDRAFAMEFSDRPDGGMIALAAAQRMIAGATTHPAGELASALQIQCVPMISRADRPGLLRLRVSPIDPNRLVTPASFSLILRAADGTIAATQPVHLETNDSAQSLTLAKPQAPPGAYSMEVVTDASDRQTVGHWFVVAYSLDAQRINSERQMSTTRPSTQPFIDAKTICRSRNALLTDQVSFEAPGVLIDDPAGLSATVQDEVAAVMKGQNPYGQRSGDQWIGIPYGGNILPARVYIPKSALDHATTVLIGLADSTDDENDWLDHLGTPILQTWADRSGTIVLIPRPLAALSIRQPIKPMLACLRNVFGLKIDRVDLIGHGLGAAAAVDFVNHGGELIDKLILVGGGEMNGVTKLPPTLLISGGEDVLFKPARCAVVMDYAQKNRLPVTHRTVPNAGHALLLGDTLKEALDWLRL